ncbi:hypothetical protein PYJP_11900 [Pyrofollis japonicus]|uniref:PaREP1 family protein n=1 Tax=Pyrofollis japonicus TaxID=3060460 RepID=UPI00295AFA03|nr:PaREP1 family protein [Pyrofollis japonicus]BEP17838.1 hypothetical protein PYJP_11900 [Pyrofollis japonicus]
MCVRASRAEECIRKSRELVERAIRDAQGGRVDLAAETLWDAVSLAVKAYAYGVDGKQIESDEELWEYKNRVAEKLGEEVLDIFQRAAGLHQCAGERICTPEDVVAAAQAAEKLMELVEKALSTRE